MNKTISNEIEKIFNTFNKLHFNNLLPIPFITYGSNAYGTLNKNAVIKNGSHYSYELTLPVEILNNSIDEIAACILHNMIHEYDYIYDKHMTSRGDTYHNKQFALFAIKCDLTCEYTDKNGWVTSVNDEFKKICSDLGFKKCWAKRYSVNPKAHSSSSVKYIDESTKESVRGTKSGHILFCFNDCPEIADEIERIYGKKRMVICE